MSSRNISIDRLEKELARLSAVERRKVTDK
jgi:hypothetical protein